VVNETKQRNPKREESAEEHKREVWDMDLEVRWELMVPYGMPLGVVKSPRQEFLCMIQQILSVDHLARNLRNPRKEESVEEV
jgi:hypothetical protein